MLSLAPSCLQNLLNCLSHFLQSPSSTWEKNLLIFQNSVTAWFSFWALPKHQTRPLYKLQVPHTLHVHCLLCFPPPGALSYKPNTICVSFSSACTVSGPLCAELLICLWLFGCNPFEASPPGSVHGDSPGKNIGVSCHDLIQGIFKPGVEPLSPTLQVDSLLTEPPGKPWKPTPNWSG